jgi:DNA polymerase IV
MVDTHLPLEDRARPLRVLFLDLNSYFASVEQQENPNLRGRPVAVIPVEADSSFVIAASYEAKRYGVKTGTRIGDARRMCPGLVTIKGNHALYSSYHRRVLEVVEGVLPIDEVCSIDEMSFRLLASESTPAAAVELARKMKQALRAGIGECLTCSIGVAPNKFLAKVGTELQKPDGLVVLQQDDLPQRLHVLKITDFPGINRRLAARLNANGIFTTEQMCAASREEMRSAFGSIVGERWWYLLRGYEVDQDRHERRSLGNSHVLPPDLRTDQGCKEVLQRLLHKAASRLRKEELWACSMSIAVGGRRSWKANLRLPATQDSTTLNEYFLNAWEDRDFEGPKSVGVTFSDLRRTESFTPSLFEGTVERSLLSHAIDGVNQKFGKNKVFLAGMHHAKDTAEERIAFAKTELFCEGKGDHDPV